MKDDWLNDLRERMSEFEMDAPKDLWAEIENAEKSRSKRNVTLILWAKRLSVAAAVLMLVGSLWYVVLPYFDKNDGGDVMALNEPANNANNINNASEPQEPYLAETLQPSSDSEEPVKQVVSPSVINESPGSDEKIVLMPHADKFDRYGNDTIQHSDSIDLHPDTNPANKHKSFNSMQPFQGLIAKNNEPGSSRVSIGVYSSGGSSSNISRRAAGESVVAAGLDNSNWEDSPMLGILLYNRGKEITTDIKHRQPLRAGISLTYKLTDWLGLGTGLSYTNLTSDLKSGSADHYFTGEQKLHYLGIPLNLTYDIVSWKRLQLYVSAGGLVEKCISGRVTTDYVLNHKSSESVTEDIDEKPFQFSVNTSAGIQLNVTQSIGLYAEPGISYYFNDGTDINTIYKDKPLNFNFNLGVRFTLR